MLCRACPAGHFLLEERNEPEMLVGVRDFGPEERAIVTSLDVARTFGKAHKDVVKAVHEMECSRKFKGENYITTDWEDEKGKRQEVIVMTRDGLVLLIGCIGDVPLRLVEAYLEQFEQMEMILQSKRLEQEKKGTAQHALTEALRPQIKYGSPFGNWSIER